MKMINRIGLLSLAATMMNFANAADVRNLPSKIDAGTFVVGHHEARILAAPVEFTSPAAASGTVLEGTYLNMGGIISGTGWFDTGYDADESSSEEDPIYQAGPVPLLGATQGNGGAPVYYAWSSAQGYVYSGEAVTSAADGHALNSSNGYSGVAILSGSVKDLNGNGGAWATSNGIFSGIVIKDNTLLSGVGGSTTIDTMPQDLAMYDNINGEKYGAANTTYSSWAGQSVAVYPPSTANLLAAEGAIAWNATGPNGVAHGVTPTGNSGQYWVQTAPNGKMFQASGYGHDALDLFCDTTTNPPVYYADQNKQIQITFGPDRYWSTLAADVIPGIFDSINQVFVAGGVVIYPPYTGAYLANNTLPLGGNSVSNIDLSGGNSTTANAYSGTDSAANALSSNLNYYAYWKNVTGGDNTVFKAYSMHHNGTSLTICDTINLYYNTETGLYYNDAAWTLPLNVYSGSKIPTPLALNNKGMNWYYAMPTYSDTLTVSGGTILEPIKLKKSTDTIYNVTAPDINPSRVVDADGSLKVLNFVQGIITNRHYCNGQINTNPVNADGVTVNLNIPDTAFTQISQNNTELQREFNDGILDAFVIDNLNGANTLNSNLAGSTGYILPYMVALQPGAGLTLSGGATQSGYAGNVTVIGGNTLHNTFDNDAVLNDDATATMFGGYTTIVDTLLGGKNMLLAPGSVLDVSMGALNSNIQEIGGTGTVVII